jgi:hypothetical protein
MKALSTDQLSKLKDMLGGDFTRLLQHAEAILTIQFNMPISYKKFSGRLHLVRDGDLIEANIEKQTFYPEDKTFIFIAKGFYWSKLNPAGRIQIFKRDRRRA